MIKMNYISGEKLQELTDHTIVLHGQYYVAEQLQKITCKYTYFQPNQKITELSPEILTAKSLFVYTHILDTFFDQIYPLLKQPFVLVTHNSDAAVTEAYQKYLNDSKIIQWFAQNVEYKHPKLIPLPIGLGNSQWPHGNLEIIQRVIDEAHPKTNFVYKNFEPNTAPQYRLPVIDQTQSIPMAPKKPYISYLRDMAQSVFCICPRGNGIDTHRMWEALYLKTIPIVPNCINNESFQDLPILMISDWTQLTPEFLKEKYNEYHNRLFNFEKLDLNYWRNRIQP